MPMETAITSYKMLINGDWVASASQKTYPVYDPSTEEICAYASDASSIDVDKAVSAARIAFDEGPWSTTTAKSDSAVGDKAETR